MKRFKCLRDGLCCRISPITLQSFEEVIVRELAKKFGVDAVLKPSYRVFDRVHRIHLALSYILVIDDEKGCPFLRDNICIIHSIYKPLICRSFPYAPKQVRYLYNDEYRFIIANVEYGLSTKCPVIKRDMDYINSLMKKNPLFIAEYMPSEYHSGLESEKKRNIILNLLSQLWRSGIVDLVPSNKVVSNRVTVNAYEFLQTFYPSLPYVLGVSSVVKKIRVLNSIL